MELYSKAKNGRIRNAFSASSEVFRFLCLLCDTDNLGGSRPSSLVERAKRYLEQHYAKQITLAQVSESLGVSGIFVIRVPSSSTVYSVSAFPNVIVSNLLTLPLVSTIRLKSNITLFIPKGAKLVSLDCEENLKSPNYSLQPFFRNESAFCFLSPLYTD